ncbi:hypothetical protein [Bordetella sp. FB-8]|uniref:hypothetical protein n=1 Tax=Bordetella sp. FB-8 TaxID=1159870 RepID=UPI00036C115E|nr:hypothetical protein [Bordetella sp. FB-8]
MSTMVMARFESVPMARSAAHALVADGFTENVVSMFYGRRPAQGRSLWARLSRAVQSRPAHCQGEILLVVQLCAADAPAAISLLRDAGCVSVEESRYDWPAGPWQRAAVGRQPVARRHVAGRTQWQP